MGFACVYGCFLFSSLPVESSCCWLHLVCSAPAKPLLKPKQFLKTHVHVNLVMPSRKLCTVLVVKKHTRSSDEV